MSTTEKRSGKEGYMEVVVVAGVEVVVVVVVVVFLLDCRGCFFSLQVVSEILPIAKKKRWSLPPLHNTHTGRWDHAGRSISLHTYMKYMHMYKNYANTSHHATHVFRVRLSFLVDGLGHAHPQVIVLFVVALTLVVDEAIGPGVLRENNTAETETIRAPIRPPVSPQYRQFECPPPVRPRGGRGVQPDPRIPKLHKALVDSNNVCPPNTRKVNKKQKCCKYMY